jgi:hypothetical protein
MLPPGNSSAYEPPFLIHALGLLMGKQLMNNLPSRFWRSVKFSDSPTLVTNKNRLWNIVCVHTYIHTYIHTYGKVCDSGMDANVDISGT